MVIQIWVLSKHFLKNERSEPATSRKTTDNIIVIILINFEFPKENENLVTLASATTSLPMPNASLMRLILSLTNETP